MAFDRREILKREAARATAAIQYYREMQREELTRERINRDLVSWIKNRHTEMQCRWARAAALIARLDQRRELTGAAEPQPNLHPLILTFTEAAAQLACGNRTVRRLVESGYLDRVQLPRGRPRVTAESVRRLVARSLQPARRRAP